MIAYVATDNFESSAVRLGISASCEDGDVERCLSDLTGSMGREDARTLPFRSCGRQGLWSSMMCSYKGEQRRDG